MLSILTLAILVEERLEVFWQITVWFFREEFFLTILRWVHLPASIIYKYMRMYLYNDISTMIYFAGLRVFNFEF